MITALTPARLHKGAELAFEDYVGTSIVDFSAELLNDDCTVMDTSVYEDFIWSVFYKRGGSLATEAIDRNSGITVEENVITINRSKIYSSLRKGLTYYHHLIGVRKLVGNELTKEEDVLWYGPIEAI